MTKYLHKIIIGQILGDAHIEKIQKNCRMSFSFGQRYLEYGNWVHSHISAYCNKPVYEVSVKTKNKIYTNYRLKTKTLSSFNTYHDKFYTCLQGKFIKIVPQLILDEIDPVVLAHFIMGDGNYNTDGRVRIFTNHYTYNECVILSECIHKNCEIQCSVIFDRMGSQGEKQHILTIGKTQLEKLQALVSPYVHHTIKYRVGI